MTTAASDLVHGHSVRPRRGA